MSDANLVKPPVGVGHMALTVADIESSHRFYATLGLRIVGKDDSMAILVVKVKNWLSKESISASVEFALNALKFLVKSIPIWVEARVDPQLWKS
jgi:catechol 2,3-dioxygenase-like lactoylglutathione lyase family enzyme